MRAAGWINLLFFSSFNLLVWLRPLPPRRRAQAVAIGVAGIGLSLPLLYLSRSDSAQALSVVRDWLPALLMPMAYWQAGLLQRAPNAHSSAAGRVDRSVLGLRREAAPPGRAHVGGELYTRYLSAIHDPSGRGSLRCGDSFRAGVCASSYRRVSVLRVNRFLPDTPAAGVSRTRTTTWGHRLRAVTGDHAPREH